MTVRELIEVLSTADQTLQVQLVIKLETDNESIQPIRRGVGDVKIAQHGGFLPVVELHA